MDTTLNGLGEVPHQAAAQCWRCKGIKSVKKKFASVQSESEKPVNIVSDVECPVCHGSGTLGRKRPRPSSEKPKKDWPGWRQVGPEPAGDCPGASGLPDEELCSLTGKWCIWQGVSTHRYSTDDVVTAWVAWRVGLKWMTLPTERQSQALHIADIGCGIGSVLQMMAWLHPTANLVGVEAQAARVDAARRSVAYNGVAHRVHVLQGDLRSVTELGPLPSSGSVTGYDLVTGTPPYFSVSDGGLPPHEEAARCLFEYRGGVEEYCKAGAKLLAPHGLLCLAGSALGLPRGYAGAEAAGLRMLGRVDVVPRAGKPPLFIVYILCRADAPYITDGQGASSSSMLVDASAFAPVPTSMLPYPDMQRQETVSSSSSGCPAAHSNETAASSSGSKGEHPQWNYGNWLTLREQQLSTERGAYISSRSAGVGVNRTTAGSIAPNAPDSSDSAGEDSGAHEPSVTFKKWRQQEKEPKERQAARGIHVKYAGRPYDQGPASVGSGSEIVHVLQVRGEQEEGSLRTMEYVRLLWELGKPG